MAMDIMDMVDMVMATMERGKPKQLPLLSQDTITMDTAIMEVTVTAIMERGKLLLSQDTITMDTAIMEVTDTVIMERGKLLLSQDTITMDTAIMDVMDTAIMERERLMLSPVIIIMAMAMVMDTMIKQQLFIDSSIFSIIDLDFLKSSQQK